MTMQHQPMSPRTSQLARIMDLEHRHQAHDGRLGKLESAHAAFDEKLDGVLAVLLQVKGGLWLAGKIGAVITGLAVVAGAVVSVLHLLGH